MKYKIESILIYLVLIALCTIPVYLQMKHEQQEIVSNN